jgi:gas vesicle protein
MNKILLGLLAGVVIGVLLAPDKGSETVKRLRGRLNDYKDGVMDQADELASKAGSLLDKGRSKVNETFQ